MILDGGAYEALCYYNSDPGQVAWVEVTVPLAPFIQEFAGYTIETWFDEEQYEYVHQMVREVDGLPPVLINGEQLMDGGHRAFAHMVAGRTTINALTGCGLTEGLMAHRYTLEGGKEVVMCTAHAKLVKAQITEKLGRELGVGNWKCAVCTMTRRLQGGQADPISTFVGSHVIIRYPTGVVMCDCMAWLMQRLPPAVRTCKHTERARWD